MTTTNLIPLSKRTIEQRKVICQKGGLARSDRKTTACRINPLKHGRYSQHYNEFTTRLIKDPQYASGHIITQIEELLARDLPVSLQIRLVEASIKWFTAVHGQRIKVLSVQAQPDNKIIIAREEAEQRLYAFIKEQEEKQEKNILQTENHQPVSMTPPL